MWELLGFNGPAVQVQDAEGRPIAIGLDDLLSGLEKHWNEDPNDLNRGRMFVQELMKYGNFERAEKVMSKIVALGGGGEDWLGLGIAQLQQGKFDKAEGTLKGAQNLLPESPLPGAAPGQGLPRQEGPGERARDDRASDQDRPELGRRLGLPVHARQRGRERRSRDQGHHPRCRKPRPTRRRPRRSSRCKACIPPTKPRATRPWFGPRRPSSATRTIRSR